MEQNVMPDAVILCGGLGTRLRSVVQDKPKVLAEVKGKPFLDHLLADLFKKGFSRIVLAVGHMGDQIVERYKGDPRIVFSFEETPLGTGGALKNAEPLITTDHFFVMNGDSMVRFDHDGAFRFHKEKGGAVSLILAKPDAREDVGSVVCDDSMRAVSFVEKESSTPSHKRFTSCGAYYMDRRALGYLPVAKPASLEYDLFPAVAKDGLCFGYTAHNSVLDIGTPDRYETAGEYLEA